MSNYYITTPIYYVNDKPHIGHAYTSLSCDVTARFQRFLGNNVYFLTGTDEHGQKVEKAAQHKNMSPKDFTDMVSQNFQDLVQKMNFSPNDFIRTTEQRHYKACQHLWQQLLDNDMIYLDFYEGWYAVRDEGFYTEDDITTKADGKKYAPTGAEVEWVKEESYFFKLSAFTDKLLQYYNDNPDFILPKSRRNEVISFVSSGLRDLSISRTTFSWGVPVPGNDKHIMYVWVDALANYLSALGYPDTNSNLYQQFWPANLHMVGKDIIRFHTVYWPALLMAANLPVPKRVHAHGWWTNEGQKISKSLGNVIDPLDLIEQYGLDQMRYFLLREVPFGNDGDFSHNAMRNRINHDLANDLGNLAMRSLSMVHKNCTALPTIQNITADDEAILQMRHDLLAKVTDLLAQQLFHKALEAIWQLVHEANRYIDKMAPWALRKTDIARMETVLAVIVDILKSCALLLQAFMPQTAETLCDMLSVPSDARGVDSYNTMLSHGIIKKPTVLFPKIEA